MKKKSQKHYHLLAKSHYREYFDNSVVGARLAAILDYGRNRNNEIKS